MPKISIIVPVYNVEKFLPRCLDSILAQTFRDWECLVIDDGSTDTSGTICDEYASRDRRFKVFHKENGGVSSARNLGLDSLTGEFVAFVDSDDWVEKEWLSEANIIINSDEYDIIRFGYYIDNGECSTINRCSKDLKISSHCDMWQNFNHYGYYGFLWNTIFRRKSICGLTFDESLCFCEDLLFLNHAILRANVSYMSSKCFYHYQRGQAVTLSSVKDPYQIYDATTKNYIIQKLIVGDDNHELLYAYHNNLVGSIIVLYKYLPFAQRRDFYIGFKVLTLHDINWRERFYLSKWIPFVLKDFIIRAYIRLKKCK